MDKRFWVSASLAILLAAAVAGGFAACNKTKNVTQTAPGNAVVPENSKTETVKTEAAKTEPSAPKEFSADVTTRGMGGAFSGKLFVSNGMTRMEMPEGIIIGRLDKNLVWMLMPQMKMYMEQPFQPQNAALSSDKMPGETSRTLMLVEDINGRKANKFKITYTLNGKDSSILQWIDVENGMPLKTAAEDGSWTNELTNVKIGPQQASLFDLPQGYTKMSMPAMK